MKHRSHIPYKCAQQVPHSHVCMKETRRWSKGVCVWRGTRQEERQGDGLCRCLCLCLSAYLFRTRECDISRPLSRSLLLSAPLIRSLCLPSFSLPMCMHLCTHMHTVEYAQTCTRTHVCSYRRSHSSMDDPWAPVRMVPC